MSKLKEFLSKYEIIVMYKNLDADRSTAVTMKLEPSTILNGSVFTVNESGTLLYEDIELRIDDPQDNVSAGLTIWLKSVVPVLKHVITTKTMCMNCIQWDRDEGQRQLKEITHKYQGGSFSRIDEIQQAIASQIGASPLTTTTVGFCPREGGMLKPQTGSTCEHYKSRGAYARMQNWFKRSTG